MKTGIIIQARMGSTRLPGKILKIVNDRTLLDHVIDRYRAEEALKDVDFVVATSDLPTDDKVEEYCNNKGITCFRGSESNVLSRYYECAKEKGFDHVVRLTADNPFFDMEEVARLIDYHISNENAFSESFSQLPIGVGAEIFSFDALEKDMEKSSMPHHFEHVDEYILENLDRFKNGTLKVAAEKNYPEIRLTVDTQDDYEKACYIAENSVTGLPGTVEAISLSDKYQSLKK